MGVVVSVMIFAKLWTPVPMAFTICYAFITLRAEDTAIIDYMVNAFRYFCTSQREYRWRKGDK